mmetsp:Transcript_128573/g.191567  ORF Transcript_128573/g.191567 Transcript_128573/m.191567 type:complete len:220 (+) Transcript_128573:186-845(+)
MSTVEAICRKASPVLISFISDILSSILGLGESNLFSYSIAFTGLCFADHVSDAGAIAEMMSIFRFSCSGFNRQIPSRSVLLTKVMENTQVHNVIPGAPPSQPLKAKQTQMVNRYYPAALNFVLELDVGTISEEKQRAAMDMLKLSAMKFQSSDNVHCIQSGSPPGASPISSRRQTDMPTFSPSTPKEAPRVRTGTVTRSPRDFLSSKTRKSTTKIPLPS